MPELRDQDLILYYYGEARDREVIRRRLDASPADRERYDELCRVLELVDSQAVPEPWDDYGDRVWQRLQPRLAEATGSRFRERWRAWWSPRRLAPAASVAVLVTLAFLAGLYWPAGRVDSPTTSPRLAAGEPTLAEREQRVAGRERILLVSVGEHLERSEMLLVELVNAPPDGATDLSGELRRAEELLPFNRLYRQAARRSGQAAVAEVLDELERLLLDVAHSDDLTVADLGDLRQRIEGGGILFRVRVVGSRVESQKRYQKQHRSPKISLSAEISGDV